MSEIYKKTESVVTREIAGETMLIPISSKLADMQNIFTLDEVSGAIWALLDGKHSSGDITASIVAEFDVTEQKASEDVEKFLGELVEAGLVEQV